MIWGSSPPVFSWSKYVPPILWPVTIWPAFILLVVLGVLVALLVPPKHQDRFLP